MSFAGSVIRIFITVTLTNKATFSFETQYTKSSALKQIYTLGFFVLLLTVTSCRSSKPTRSDSYPDRYTIITPPGYKIKPSLMKKITEILPSTLTEVKGKQVCLDCQAGLTAKLEVSEPELEVYNSKENTIKVYRFSAAFVLYDSTGKGLVKLKLVDPVDDAFVWERPRVTGSGAPGTYRLERFRFVRIGDQLIKEIRIVEDTYTNKLNNASNSKNAGPTIDDQMIIVEKKIHEMREMLEQNAAN